MPETRIRQQSRSADHIPKRYALGLDMRKATPYAEIETWNPHLIWSCAMSGRKRLWILLVGVCLTTCLLAMYSISQAEWVHNKTVFPKQISPYYVWGISERPRGTFNNLRAAIDGNNLTTVTSKKNFQGASVTIDFGRPSLFNMITVNHGKEPSGFCERIAVSTSLDGRKFIHRSTFPGRSYFSAMLLGTPVRARFVRLTAVARGSKQWTISEIYFQ